MKDKRPGVQSLIEMLQQAGMRFEDGAGNAADAETEQASDDSGDGRARNRAKTSDSDTSSSASGSNSKSRPERVRPTVGGGGGSFGNLNFDFLRTWGRRAIIIAIIVLILVLLFCYWWFHPPINIHSVDTWFFVSFFILLPLYLVFRQRSRTFKAGTTKVVKNAQASKNFKRLSYLPVLIVIVGLLGGLASQSFFPGNAERYASVLQTDTLDFTQDIQEVNYSEIPVIDRNSAALLGTRTMGSIPQYVSQFEISDIYSQINYQGKPVRVSPLIYADLVKWFTNRDDGIPAYVMVDMTTQDTQIVRLEEPIYYSESEPLERNIDRHVQLSYPFYMFDQKSFEIDDEGRPWWICPVQSRTIGLFGGTTISRVILCNATTGECQDFAIEDCPQWVDRAYPAELLIQQYNWSGAYSSGWINSWLGQQGVIQTTPGTNNMEGYNYIAKDDDVWVYTGVTSATADESIIGFVLINQRTAQSHFYSVAGATEVSAMASAEGQVQHLGYEATFPLLINVSGQPTYFMALKDNAGLVKQYAMLDIQRYQTVVVGNTVAECQNAYISLLAADGVLTDEQNTEGAVETTGTIVHITDAVVDGNSHFYVRLEGDSRIYDFALPALLEIVGYGVGDSITFTYYDTEQIAVVQGIGAASSS